MKAWRKANPLKYAFRALKDNAKQRGKVFELTFEQFKDFAVKTDYINKRGRTAQAYHIDRKREEEGYTFDNIQVLTNSENVKKYVAFKYRDRDGSHFETITEKPNEQGNAPF